MLCSERLDSNQGLPAYETGELPLLHAADTKIRVFS